MTESILLNDRYMLQEMLGSGGMSVVYRAHDRMLERDVAIKILREKFSGDQDFRSRFHQEAKAAANLSHPNIVTIHDFGLDAGRLFIVMEFVPGDHLKNMIKKQGRFSVDDTLFLIKQACAGIGYAHRAALVHCDVKPHNMLITPDFRLKVVDFGIARAIATIHPEEKFDVVWGSPQYFSPEQAAGSPPSPASDVYAIGVIMYEMLTGELPFSASSPEELARLHRELPPPSPSQLNREIPAALEQIIIKVLSKEPSARYRTADQLGRVLGSFNQHAGPSISLDTPVVAEQTAQSSPSPSPQGSSTPSYPRYAPRRSASQARTHKPTASGSQPAVKDPLKVDWITILLGLLALIAIGGLLPFYLWVMFLYR